MADTPAPDSTFHLFEYLSHELRDEIWKLAFYQRRVIPVKIVPGTGRVAIRRDIMPATPLLAVNQEARKVALRLLRDLDRSASGRGLLWGERFFHVTMWDTPVDPVQMVEVAMNALWPHMGQQERDSPVVMAESRLHENKSRLKSLYMRIPTADLYLGDDDEAIGCGQFWLSSENLGLLYPRFYTTAPTELYGVDNPRLGDHVVGRGCCYLIDGQYVGNLTDAQREIVVHYTKREEARGQARMADYKSHLNN